MARLPPAECAAFFGLTSPTSCGETHDAAEASEVSSTQSVVHRLRTLTGGPRRKQRGEQPLPAVEKKDSTLATTAAEAKQCWLEHFSSIEDGNVRTARLTLPTHVSRDRLRGAVSREQAPSLGLLEWARRDASTDRAYGLDGLPGELLHYCAADLARPLYQLQLKSILTLAEPIQHKGGVCIVFTSARVLGSSVLLIPWDTCFLGCQQILSQLHSCVVGAASPLYKSVAFLGTQLRYQRMPHLPVCLPPQGLLPRLLDLQEAFYWIVRPLITGGPLTEDDLARACQAVNLPCGVYHDLQQHVQQPALSRDAGAGEWALLPWKGRSRKPGFDSRVSLNLSRRASARDLETPSDLVFRCLFARVLRRIRLPATFPLSRGTPPCLAASLPPREEIELLDSTWMDDLSLMLQAPDAATFLHRLQFGAATLL